MTMHCNNQTAIFIANNPIFHERIKHIEDDYHYVHDMAMREVTYTQYSDQLADIFEEDQMLVYLVLFITSCVCLRESIRLIN